MPETTYIQSLCIAKTLSDAMQFLSLWIGIDLGLKEIVDCWIILQLKHCCIEVLHGLQYQN